MADTGWTRLFSHAYTRALPGWQANVGLVVGTDRALVVDAGAGPDQAAALLAAVRGITPLPLVLVLTHAHFDHVFGAAYLMDAGAEAWAHERAIAELALRGEVQRREVAAIEPDFAAGRGPHARIAPPARAVGAEPVEIALGGITATVFHAGRGHTDGDLLVGAGDVLFAGDLVEEGADPAFENSFPREWVRTLRRIPRGYRAIVPGHGAVVDPEFVARMADTMDEAIDALGGASGGALGGAPDGASGGALDRAAGLPYGREQAAHLARRVDR